MKKRIKIGNIILLIAGLLLIGMASAEAQVTPYNKPKNFNVQQVAKQQYSVSWEYYQKTYKKNMLDQAKAERKANNEEEKEEKDRQKFLARLERIKK